MRTKKAPNMDTSRIYIVEAPKTFDFRGLHKKKNSTYPSTIYQNT